MRIPVVVIALGLLAGACQSKSDSHSEHNHAVAESSAGPVADLEQQVMAVHDSVMPKISDILRLKKEVTAKVEKTTDPAAKEMGVSINSRLTEADKAMMDWMHQYNGDTLGKLDQTKAVEYLKDQQRKVNDVRDQMQKSIADAQKYLQ